MTTAKTSSPLDGSELVMGASSNSTASTSSDSTDGVTVSESLATIVDDNELLNFRGEIVE